MIELQMRFLALFVVVSALGALGAGLLISGAGHGDGVLIGAGGVVGLLALRGIVVLARFVIATDREARR